MTGKRLARGIGPLWLGVALAFGAPATARAQEAGPATDTASPASSSGPASSVAPADVTPPVPHPALPEARLPGPALDSIERAWTSSPGSVADRAERTRAEADEVGVASLDALGRALVFGTGGADSPLARARAAVLLAPDLPASHAALARAEWSQGSYGSALSAAIAAVRALPLHLDGWLWLGATGSVLLLFAGAGGALLFVAARGLTSVSHLAHDLGDRIEPSMPDFSRVALVAALVLMPAAFGEGVAGVGLALFALGVWRGGRAQRIALACAAGLFVGAIHPLAHIAGAQLAAIAADPVVAAAAAAEAGALDPVDAQRLVHAAGDPGSAPASDTGADPLAAYSLAQWQKRSGDLAGADARLAALTKDDEDVAALASAASVKIALGDPNAAIDLYRRAIAIEPSALLWFNLSQAHGRAIDVEQHDTALAAAQSLDAEVVSELTEKLAAARGGWVADYPLPPARLHARLLSTDGRAAARELSRPFAPGGIGRTGWIAALAFAIAGALGIALRRQIEPSTTCLDCGTRLCHRCGTAPDAMRNGIAAEARCEPCRRSRSEVRAGASWDARPRGVGVVGLARAVLASLLPGLWERSARRPVLGLFAALAAAGALAFGFGASAVVPDPASVGDAGAFAFGAATAFCVALYAAIAGLAVRLARRGRG